MKRRINWKFVIVIFLCVALMAITLVQLRNWRKSQIAEQGLSLGNTAYDEGRWLDAAQCLGRYLGRHPDDVPVMLKYADALLNIRPLKKNYIQQAEAAYRSVLRVEKGNYTASSMLVELYVKMKEYTEAAFIAREFLADNDDPKMSCFLAVALMEQRQFEDAAAQLQGVIDNHPDFVLAYDIYGKLVTKQPDVFPTTPPDYWYQQVVRNNPDSARAYLFRAEYYLRNGDRPKAEKDMEQAESLQPSDADIIIKLTNLLIDAGEYDKAKACLDRLGKNEENLNTWMAWAKLARLLRDNALMVQVAEQGLDAMHNQRWDFMASAIELYIQADQLETAEQLIASMRDQDMFLPVLLFYEGMIAEKQQKSYLAIEKWNQAIEQGFSPPELYLATAALVTKTGDRISAGRLLREGIAEHTDNINLNVELARLMMTTRQWREAMECARRARQLSARWDVRLLYDQIVLRENLDKNTPMDDPIWNQLELDLNDLEKSNPNSLELKLLRFQLTLYRQNYTLAETIVADWRSGRTSDLRAAMAETDLRIAQNRIDDAVAVLRKTISEFPEASSPVKAMALLLRDVHPDEAEAVVKEAINRLQDPTDRKELTLLLASLYRYWKENDQARDRLAELAEQYPQDIRILRQLLRSKEINTNMDKAQPYVDRIKSIEGQSGRQWRYEQAKLWVIQADSLNQGQPRNFTQIVTLLNENLRIYPDDLESMILLAYAHKQAGELATAISLYREAYQHAPDDLSVIIPFVMALKEDQEYEQAEKIIQQASRDHLSSSLLSKIQLQNYLMAGDFEMGTAFLENLLEANPDDQQYLLMMASLKMQQGNLDEAKTILENLRRQSPDSLPVTLSMIDLKIQQGQSDQAIALCNELIQKQNNAAAYLVRGQIYDRINQPELAETDFTKARALEPDNPMPWIRLAEHYVMQHRDANAVRTIQDALELYPDNQDIQKQAMKLFLASNHPDTLEKGANLLQKMLQQYPQDSQLQLFQVRQLLRVPTKPNCDRAIQVANQITQDSPKQPQAWLILADIFSRQGQTQKALEIIRKGLLELPKNRDLLLFKAKIERDRSLFSSIVTLKTVNELYPNDLNTVLQLADMYLLANEIDEALELLRKYASIGDSSSQRKISIATEAAQYKKTHSEESLRRLEELYQKEPDDFYPLLTVARLLKDGRKWDRLESKSLEWASRYENADQWLIPIAADLAGAGETPPRKIAETILRFLIEKNDRLDMAMQIMATLCLQSEKIDEAEMYYKKVLEINSGNSVVCNNLAWILSQKKGQYPQALKIIEEGLEKSPPDYLDIIDTRGMIYYQTGELEKALEDFEKCTRLYSPWAPGLTSAWFHVGLVRVKMGQKSRALDAFQKAIELHGQIGGLSDEEMKEARQWQKKIAEGA